MGGFGILEALYTQPPFETRNKMIEGGLGKKVKSFDETVYHRSVDNCIDRD